MKNLMYKIFKRLFDFLASFLTIIFLMPFLIPVMLVLKFTGEGEIFYFQKRVGKDNKDFFIYKFATMLKDSEKIGSGIYTAKNDSRILPVGNFLRKTKINELPQLFNILLGHISIVGPRPLIRRTFNLYSENDQKLISSIKPGLTGIGSIVFRNEEELLNKASGNLEEYYEKNITPFKAELEKWYVKNKSFQLDIIIIFITAWAIPFKNTMLPWKFFKDLPRLDK